MWISLSLYTQPLIICENTATKLMICQSVVINMGLPRPYISPTPKKLEEEALGK